MPSSTTTTANSLCSSCRHMLLHTQRRSYSSAIGTAMRQRCPQKVIHDYLTPMPSHQLSTLLNDLMPETERHHAPSQTVRNPPSVLPQGAHLAHFPPLMAASDLAPDGADADHVPVGFALAPDGGKGGHRLWAGGELTFREGWRSRMRLDGGAWTCREEIGNVGARGEKTFVDVWRRYGLDGREWDIEERRTLAFVKGDGLPSSPSPRSVKFPQPPTASYTLTPSPTHLFHFSALSYNAHFIHLARSTALVHGPLLLALMLRALDSNGVGVKHIVYRNLAPLCVGQQARVCLRAPAAGGEKWDVWVEGPGGKMAVRGKVEAE